MALDNLRCPQFVDFTNRATFDIHDGADVYFERGVVGELGLGFDDDINNPNDDGIDELIAALNSHTTLNTKSKNDNKKDSGISEAFSMSTNHQVHTSTNEKTNVESHNDTTSITTSHQSKKNDNNNKKEPTRKRTTSACSNTSVGSNKTSTKLQNSQINSSSSSNNKNIVKKTIAKVTAAFKTNKLAATNESQLKIKTKQASSALNQQKKKQEPLKVEYNNKKQEQIIDENLDHETTSSTNRRCSSVPRTLKERQAVATEERARLRNIADNDENNENKPIEKKQQQQTQQNHRSRVQTDEEIKVKPNNKAANTSRNANNSQIQRQPTLTEPKSPNFSKPRQRSCDRKDMPLLPYQGVKFIPKLSHKYTSVEPFTNLEERARQLGVKREAKKLQEIEPNKPMIALNDNNNNNKKPIMITTTQTVTQQRLNNSLNTKLGNNTNSNKENSMCSTTITTIETTHVEVKQMNSTTTTTTGNDSIISNKAGNLSTLSNSSRKRVDLKPMNLHTEQRAQKRHQYDQYLKDKERMAELIKKNLEMQKIIESKNEIQKLRTQCLFKSKPFKYTKPMEIKPSEKPLTEPKSPALGCTSTIAATTSSSKLNSTNGSIKGPMRSLSQDNIRLA